jgi:acyl-CoA-binding protein
MEFEYDNFEDAKRQVRHLKDLGANSQIIRLYETVPV